MEEERAEDRFPLVGYDGPAIDHLLVITASGATQFDPIIRWARRGLRSGRPTNDWVWDVAIENEMSALVTPELNARSHEAIADAIAVAHGSLKATSASSKWRFRGSAPTDAEIELAEFRTTRSFDEVRDRFRSHIESDDQLGLLLRGHLWIETSINLLLQRALKKPGALDDVQLGFRQRVAIAGAVGVIAEDEEAAIRLIGKLRNRCAHRLDSELTVEDQRDLINACSGRIRTIAGVEASAGFPQGIAAVISTLVIMLHSRVDEIDAQRRYEAYLGQSVARVLGPQEL